MGIMSVENTDRLLWLGRYSERVYTTLRIFGMPYVVLHHPRPFDTATLNYNWQIWDTKAFSMYTTSTGEIDRESAFMGERAILNFLSKQGVIRYSTDEGYISRVVESTDLIDVRTNCAGFFEGRVKVQESVEKGQVLARIIHPYEAVVKEELVSPVEGTVAFIHNETLAYQNTAVIKIIANQEQDSGYDNFK